MNTMNRKAAMCGQLNMSFDEANELFGEESLESMQMARVNGGVGFLVLLGAVAAVATIVGVGYTIYQDQKELPADGSTPAEMSESALKSILDTAGPGSIFTFDSIVGDKMYGIRLEFHTPTPGR